MGAKIRKRGTPVRCAVSLQVIPSQLDVQPSTFSSTLDHDLHICTTATDADASKTLMVRKYRYRPLKTATSIRILQLDPGSGHAPLKGRLLRVDLRTTLQDIGATSRVAQRRHIARIHGIGPYEALSYVWGSPVLDREIACPGGSILITRNLDEVLRAVRLELEPRYVWADGICINQRDDRERSRQVKMMGAVYARAVRVLIWLGQDPDDKANETFHRIARIVNLNLEREERDLVAQVVRKV